MFVVNDVILAVLVATLVFKLPIAVVFEFILAVLVVTLVFKLLIAVVFVAILFVFVVILFESANSAALAVVASAAMAVVFDVKLKV